MSLLGVDLWEMTAPSLQHNRYVLGVTDYTTSFAMVYFMDSKRDALHALGRCLDTVTTMGHHPRRLRLDNDPVFRGGQFETFCASRRIQPTYSAPYSQFQNGVQGRCWRTLAEMALAMLRYATLPVEY